MGHFEVLQVTNKEAMAGRRAEASQFGIPVFLLRNLDRAPVRHGSAAPIARHVRGQAAMAEEAVGHLDVFDQIGRNARKDRRCRRVRVVADDV